MSLKIAILALARLVGLFALSRKITTGQVRILAYHGIWLGGDHFGNFLYMSAEKFQRRMDLLEELGYPVIPLDEALSKLGKDDLPAAATVITIDDGWYGTYQHMLPTLKARCYPASLYLTTYYCLNQMPVIDVALQYCFQHAGLLATPTIQVPQYDFGPLPTATEEERAKALSAAIRRVALLNNDNERQTFLRALCQQISVDYEDVCANRWFHLMTPDEVASAADNGITIELHTHHHRITHLGEDCLSEELVLNARHIQKITGSSPRNFCYPSGVFSPKAWPALNEMGITSATTTTVGLVDRKCNLYALPRIMDGQNISDLEFEAEMSGFMEILRRMRFWRGHPST